MNQRSCQSLAARFGSLRLAGQPRSLILNTKLRLDPGEIVVLSGASGSGKTSILHVLVGLLPWARPAELDFELRLGGESIAELDPSHRAPLLGACLDRPAGQLFLRTPRAEIAAASRLYGDTPAFEQAARQLKIEPFLDQRTNSLSSGQQQRVALSVALAAAPRPLLLDEPTAHLDADGIAALTSALDNIRRAGGSALIVEHAPWRFLGCATRWLQIRGRRIIDADPPSAPVPAPVTSAAPGATILEAGGLTIAAGGRTLLEDADLSLAAGEIVLLSGANGSGKSCLSRVLAGFERPVRGEVRLEGTPLRRGGRVALMLPDPDLQLFARSVEEELASAKAKPHEVARVLERHELSGLASRAPWTLSRGERQRLVHASLDLQQPHVVIIDEPAQGLAREDIDTLIRLMARRAAGGRAHLVISHREEFRALAARELRIEDRRLVPLGGPAS